MWAELQAASTDAWLRCVIETVLAAEMTAAVPRCRMHGLQVKRACGAGVRVASNALARSHDWFCTFATNQTEQVSYTGGKAQDTARLEHTPERPPGSYSRQFRCNTKIFHACIQSGTDRHAPMHAAMPARSQPWGVYVCVRVSGSFRGSAVKHGLVCTPESSTLRADKPSNETGAWVLHHNLLGGAFL